MAQGAGEVSVQVVRSGRRQIRIVRGVSLPGQGVILPAHVGGRHPLLFLSPIAKPDSDHLLLQAQLFGQHGYFLLIRNEYFVSTNYVFCRKRRSLFRPIFLLCIKDCTGIFKPPLNQLIRAIGVGF